MDFNALIPELAKAGTLVLVLGSIAYLAYKAYMASNDSRITEIKENNKALSEIAMKTAAAMQEQAAANDKQTIAVAANTAELNGIANRLTAIEARLAKE